MSIRNITTNDEFQQYVECNTHTVLVDFWAEWCPPCRAMAPILHKLSEDLEDDVDIVKVDVEASQDNAMLAQRHNVKGIPNMQIYRDGKVVDVIIGMVPESALKARLTATR